MIITAVQGCLSLPRSDTGSGEPHEYNPMPKGEQEFRPGPVRALTLRHGEAPKHAPCPLARHSGSSTGRTYV